MCMKGNKLEVYISLKENIIECFLSSWDSFQVTTWFIFFEESIFREVHISSPLWCKHALNMSARHTKYRVSEFPSLAALKLPLCKPLQKPGILKHS